MVGAGDCFLGVGVMVGVVVVLRGAAEFFGEGLGGVLRS